MTRPWLIIPVKPFAEGKSRLSMILSAGEREGLARRMFRHVLNAARDAQVFERIMVVSRDREVLAIANETGVECLLENGSGLNAALDQARRYAVGRGAQSLVVLPADLPAITADELRCFVQQAPSGRGLAIAPSTAGGTNALYLCPPDLIPFSFGEGSSERHLDLARQNSAAVEVRQSPLLSFDLDLPDDLSHPALSESESRDKSISGG
jgi:2-phospho-L-lactate guanylyltransferase